MAKSICPANELNFQEVGTPTDKLNIRIKNPSSSLKNLNSNLYLKQRIFSFKKITIKITS